MEYDCLIESEFIGTKLLLQFTSERERRFGEYIDLLCKDIGEY